ncbi:MAG: ATP-binding protein [Bdellovibrionaceae bacterium]|nr:ATP-binding protein [Pseudobdellovibrionaceae bacterium]
MAASFEWILNLTVTHIVLSVTDSGLGMSPTMIKNIYEFSTNSSRRGTGGEAGTGFGIPILAKTMKAFGGSISFNSEMETPEKPGSTRVELTLQGTMDVEIAQTA